MESLINKFVSSKGPILNQFDDKFSFKDGFGNGLGSEFTTISGKGDCSGNLLSIAIFGYENYNGTGSGNYNIKTFNKHKVYYIDSIPTLIYSIKDNIAKGAIIRKDFTLKDCYIAKVDGYFAHGETSHKAFNDAQIKSLQQKPIEDRVKEFVYKYPDPNKEIPVNDLFVWHNVLTGSYKFGRGYFLESHNINRETDLLTVKEFIELTKDSYKGDNIKLLLKKYDLLDNQR